MTPHLGTLEGLLSPIALLLHPFVLLPLLGITVWGTVRWSRRRRQEEWPSPLFTEPWAWIGWAVVAAYTLLAVGLAFFAWQPALLVACLLVAPLGAITVAIVRAKPAHGPVVRE